MFALEDIAKASFVTEYKYEKIYPYSHRAAYEKEYEINDEGCYVMDVYVQSRKMCIDATRRLKSLGRYVCF